MSHHCSISIGVFLGFVLLVIFIFLSAFTCKFQPIPASLTCRNQRVCEYRRQGETEKISGKTEESGLGEEDYY